MRADRLVFVCLSVAIVACKVAATTDSLHRTDAGTGAKDDGKAANGGDQGAGKAAPQGAAGSANARSGAGGAAGTSAAAGSGGSAAAPTMIEDHFEGTDSGWTIVGDAEATSVKPEQMGSCGHDGGCISAKDAVTGGTWFYQAPSSYLGDHSAAYGRFLEYDLVTTASSNPFEEFDVVLSGNGLVVAYDAAPTPVADVWTTYKVKLDETSGWRLLDREDQIWSSDFANAMPPTQAQFKAILGAVTRLRIRGEFQNGADSGSLDNVKFGTPQ